MKTHLTISHHRNAAHHLRILHRVPKRVLTRHRITFVFVILIMWLSNDDLKALQERATQAPDNQTFALDPEQEGLGEETVNLFTGDVNLPVNLVQLPGRGGMDINVTMSYSSNIQHVEDVWNLEAPTGILGLGWSMDVDKIIADHKQTGNRHDDDFYLVSGGSTIRLIQTGYDGSTKTYETSPYQFWKIRYYAGDERWEITKEDGTTWVFGGGISTDGAGNRNSERNTVQWGVKWGNWIGASGRTSGQQQHAITWNLSRIQDRWDNAVTYTYDVVVEQVGRTGNPDFGIGKQHTKASYLSQITNPEGKTIRFVYGEKEALGLLKEYYDPHTDPVPAEKISALITGPTWLNENETGTWYASASGGSSPYQYSWSYRYTCRSSCSGEGSWFSGGSGSSFTYSWTSWISQLEIRLNAQDSQGRPGEDYHYTAFASPSGGGDPGPGPEPILLTSTTSVMSGSLSYEPSSPAGTITQSSDPNEPDAWQEKYETRFLDYILVKNEAGESLFAIDLDYEFNGDGQQKPPKRLLSSVRQVMLPGEESLPGLAFSYYDSIGSIHPGALKTVTWPAGARVTYSYSEKTIGRSNREIVVTPPANYGSPRVFIGNDYVVTTWKSGSSLKLKLYRWDGEWMQYEYGPISYAGTLIDNNKQNFEVFLEEDFFILIDRFYENTTTKKVYAFRKDEARRDNWHLFSPSLSFDNFRLDRSAVATGNDFFAITDLETGALYRYIWRNGGTWRSGYLNGILSGASDPNFFIGGSNNYIVFDKEYGSGPDQLSIYWIDENKKWQSRSIGTSITQFESSTGSSTDRNYIWADQSHFAVLAKGTWESIFRLKEDYSLTNVYNIGSFRDEDPVFMIDNSSVILAQNGDFTTINPKQYRFDGVQWRTNSLFNDSQDNNIFSAGIDLIVRRKGHYSSGEGQYATYNPNTSAWSGSVTLTGPAVRTLPAVGNRFFVFGHKGYYMEPSGNVNSIGDLYTHDGGLQYYSMRTGVNFVAYQALSGGFYKSYIQLIKNGIFTGLPTPFYASHKNLFDQNNDYQQSHLVGSTTVALSDANSLSNATQLRLHRVTGDGASGLQKDYPVTSVVVHDGYQNQTITLDYHTANATYDPTGLLAQYNKTSVSRGTGQGTTEHYFINGLASGDSGLTEPYPSGVLGNEMLLKGLPYVTKIYNEAGGLVSQAKNTWKVHQKIINNAGVQIAQATWIRQIKTENTIDGVTSTIEHLFDLNTGLPTRETTYNYDADGNQQMIQTFHTYWWQHYDTGRSQNLLTPVIKTETKVNSILTGVSATTWKEWDAGKWASHKSYRWKGTGSSAFNFASWSGGSEPPADWVKLSNVDSRDALGNMTGITDVEGISTVRHMVKNGTRPGALFTNAAPAETDYINMDTFRSTSYGTLAHGLDAYHNGNGTLSYSSSSDPVNSSAQRIEVDNLTSRGAGASAALSGLVPGKSYIVDFDYKLTEGKLNVTIWASATGTALDTIYDIKGGWKTARITWTYQSGQAIFFRAPWNGNGANNVTFYLDNIRIYPAGGYATSYSYDAVTGQTESVFNEDNIPLRYQYDTFQRPGSVIDHRGRVLSQQGYFHSRSRNGGLFSASDPNFTSSVAYSDESGYHDFASSSGWSVSGSDITFGAFQDGVQTVRMGTDGNWNTITRAAGTGDVVARVDFYADGGTAGTPHVLYFDGSGHRFGVQYLPGSDRFQIQYRFNSGSYQYPFTFAMAAPPNAWYTVEIVKRTDGTSKAWVYPKGGSRSEANAWSLGGYPGSWNASIKSSSNDDYYWLANFYGGSYNESMEFTDGLARPIQTQTRTDAGSDYIVAHTQYDGLGRKWKSWNPYPWNSGGVYDGAYAAHARDYYGGTGRLYGETLYYSDPLSRTQKVIPPDNGTAGVQYAWGSSSIGGQLFNYSDVTGLDNVTGRTWSDRQGNTIRSTAASGTTEAVTSAVKADPVSRITESRPPHWFAPPAGSAAADWLSVTHNDFRGRTIQADSPDTGTLKYIYDDADRLRFTQDAVQAAAGRTGFTRYDALGRAVAGGEAAASFSTLNGNQNYSFETGDLNQIQASAFDGKPSSAVFPWSLFTTELNGAVLANTHGKLAAEAFKTDGRAASGGGSANSQNWQLTLYSYDADGRPAARQVFTQGKPALNTLIEYTYNHLGDLLKQRVRVGTSQNFYHFYEYNSQGQLAKVYTNTTDTKPSTPGVSYTYNEIGQLTGEDVSGQTKADMSYTYDLKGRIKSISNGDGSFSEAISYNADGTIQSTAFTNGGVSYSYSYTYDKLDRLTAANYSTGTTNFDVNGISYDKHGNFKTLKRYFDPSLVDNLTYTHQTGTNKLQSVADAVPATSHDWDAEDAAFTYDANGNMKTNTGRGVENIGYDTRNLPVSMQLNNGLAATYRYNTGGWRTLSKTEDGGVTTIEEHYIMDEGTVLAVTDAAGAVQFWNLYGNGLFGRQEAGGAKKYYLKDHLGSTRQVINSSGSLLEYYDYYPFGLVLRSNVAGQQTKETFTGKEQDPATGYYYFGSRYYDAALAGWGVVDPAGQFASPYVYAGNPVSFVDPDGEFFLPVVIGAAAIGAFNGIRTAASGAPLTDVISSITGGFTKTAVIGGFSAGAGTAVGGSLGSVAPSFSEASLVGRYAGKAGFAALVGSASATSGMFVTDFLNDGRINFSASSYLRRAGYAALTAAGISLGYSAYDYFAWDRFSPERKLEILRNEFDLKDVKLQLDESGFARQIGYTAEYSPFDDPITISLTEKALSNRFLARTTMIHELQHHSDLRVINFYRDIGALGNNYVRNYIEQRGYLAELNAASINSLPIRYVNQAKRGLTRHGFQGSLPNVNFFKSIWLNIFR